LSFPRRRESIVAKVIPAYAGMTALLSYSESIVVP
jgi:hypothetical protein